MILPLRVFGSSGVKTMFAGLAIGPIAKPRQIMLTPELPKTRSGKIMRRLLRDVADDRPLGDVTTLLDPSVVNSIKEHLAEGGGEDKE